MLLVIHCRLRLKHRAVRRDSKNKRKIGKYVSMQMRAVSWRKGGERQTWSMKIQQVKRCFSS